MYVCRKRFCLLGGLSSKLITTAERRPDHAAKITAARGFSPIRGVIAAITGSQPEQQLWQQQQQQQAGDGSKILFFSHTLKQTNQPLLSVAVKARNRRGRFGRIGTFHSGDIRSQVVQFISPRLENRKQ